MQKNKHDLSLPFMVIIVGVVAIVAIVTLVSNGTSGVEGAPVYKFRLDQSQYGCVDDDSKNDYDKPGTVEFGPFGHLDYCMNGRLYQFYCATSNTVGITQGYECPNGCLNGVCIAG